MIDENATLKALVRELREVLKDYLKVGDAGMQQVAEDALAIFDKYRDNPVRGPGGGEAEISPYWHSPSWDGVGGAVTILPQPSLAERDAAQEAEWRKLFEP